MWTVDTLSYPPELFTLHGVWGANPNDIWAIAYAPSTNHSLWHYNGIKWEVQSNILLSSNLQSIYGFAANDIWIINDPGNDIFHYNGVSWTKVGNFKYPGYEESYFNDIWGSNSSEIYVAGSAINGSADTVKSFIMKYNGSSWQFMDIPDLNVNLVRVRKNSPDNLLYLSGLNFYSTGDIFYTYVYDGKTFKKLYEGSKSMYIGNIRGKVYVYKSSEKKIYRYENNELVEWKNFAGTQYIGSIFGRSEIDFFTLGNNNTLLHYNGTDLQQIYQAQNSFNGSLVLEKDIFLLSKGQYNYVIHGKLID